MCNKIIFYKKRKKTYSKRKYTKGMKMEHAFLLDAQNGKYMRRSESNASLKKKKKSPRKIQQTQGEK